MISSTLRVTACRASTRMMYNATERRCMSTIGDQLKSKKKVEEDRYIKAQEAARAKLLEEKRAAEAAVVAATEAEAHYNEEIVPVMDEIAEMLEETGDVISPEALEQIAKWKLGK